MDLVDVRSWRAAADRADLALAVGERVVGGGTWLFSEPQPGTTGLVDLTSLGWPAWEHAPDGGLRIAGTATIRQVQQAPWGALAELVRRCCDGLVMSFKVQHAATVGGNLALGLPAGAMISLLSALDGRALIWTPDGERVEQVADLVVGDGRTTLVAGEVIRAIDVPPEALRRTYVHRRIALTEHGRSSVVVIGRSGDRRLTVTAATPRPSHVSAPADLDDLVWFDDAHGAPDWRESQARRLAAEIWAAL
ncbi:FAD binding domain-containing protein [Nocardioides ultimimeridianus]